MSMNDNFGPFGWFVTKEEVDLEVANISWIEEDAMWMFLYRQIHSPITQKVQKGRIDPTTLVAWEYFRAEINSKRPLAKLRDHYQKNMAPNLHKAKIPTETKLMLYFALDIPVSYDFLRPMQKDATIILDATRRIKFLRHNIPGGLRLDSVYVHRNLPPSKPRIRKAVANNDTTIWAFLHEKVFEANQKLTRKMIDVRDPKLWEEYKLVKEDERFVSFLMGRFLTKLAPELDHTAWPWVTKIMMHYALDIPFEKSYSDVLKLYKGIEMDKNHYIVNLVGEEIPTEAPFTDEETRELWMYVYKKTMGTRSGTVRVPREPSIMAFWRDFVPKSGVKRKLGAYVDHYVYMMALTLQHQKLDTRVKVSLLFTLQIPITPEFLKTLSEDAFVEVNRRGCIVRYKEKRKRVRSVAADVVDIASDHEEVETEPKKEKNEVEEAAKKEECETENPKVAQFTEKDDNDIWMFVLDKCGSEGQDKAEQCLENVDTWNQLLTTCDSTYSAADYHKRFFTELLPNFKKARLSGVMKAVICLSFRMTKNPDLSEDKTVQTIAAVAPEVAHDTENTVEESASEDTSDGSGEVWEMDEIQEVVESMIQNLEETNDDSTPDQDI